MSESDIRLFNDLVDIQDKRVVRDYLVWSRHYNKVLYHLYSTYIKTHPRIRINFERFCSAAYNATLTEYDTKELRYKRPLSF